jgi:signal peptidase
MPTEAVTARAAQPGVARPAPRRWRARVRIALGWVQIALTIGITVFWFVALRPQGIGGPASFALVSGTSMEPLYHTGDVVIMHRRPSYGVGDIISYRVPRGEPGAGAQVIHRIVGGDAAHGFVVQGDNRTAPDIWHPHEGDIVGRAWAHIPGAGVVIRLLHTPLVLAGLAAIAAMVAVVRRKPGPPVGRE